MIKVILLDNVPGHGLKNDIADVSDGFARNFLLPKSKAVIATPEAIEKLEEKKSKYLAEEEKAKEKNLELKEKINGLKIEIQKRAGEGKLFGSLSAKEISDSLKARGIKIEPKNIVFNEPVKSLGEHKIGIILDKNVKAVLGVNVIEEVQS